MTFLFWIVHVINQSTIDLNDETEKHLEMLVEVKLDFKKHIENLFMDVHKTIRLQYKFQKMYSRIPLITIYRCFIKPHLFFKKYYVQSSIKSFL